MQRRSWFWCQAVALAVAALLPTTAGAFPSYGNAVDD
jgi:hypothetical protein